MGREPTDLTASHRAKPGPKPYRIVVTGPGQATVVYYDRPKMILGRAVRSTSGRWEVIVAGVTVGWQDSRADAAQHVWDYFEESGHHGL